MRGSRVIAMPLARKGMELEELNLSFSSRVAGRRYRSADLRCSRERPRCFLCGLAGDRKPDGSSSCIWDTRSLPCFPVTWIGRETHWLIGDCVLSHFGWCCDTFGICDCREIIRSPKRSSEEIDTVVFFAQRGSYSAATQWDYHHLISVEYEW